MTAGIKDIAAVAGVSAATVSRVLSGKSVRAAYRARVEEALRTIDYRPNLAARRLRTPQAGAIGIIVPDLTNSFFAGFVRMVEDLAWVEGLRVIICDSNHDPEREAVHRLWLEEERVSGLLIAPAQAFGTTAVTGPPTILFDRADGSEPCDTVMLDNEAATIAMVASLENAGARSILGLFNDDGVAAIARERGFMQASDPGNSDRQLVRIPIEPDARRAAVLSAVAATPGADALLAVNDDILLEAACAIGLDTPLMLACFDDAPWLRLRPSKLHVVAQPVEEMAHVALAMLIDRLGGCSGAPRRVVFPGTIIDR